MKRLIAASTAAAAIFALVSYTQNPEEVTVKDSIDGPPLEPSPAFEVFNEVSEGFLLPTVPDSTYTTEMRDSDCGLYEVFYSPEAERKYIEEGLGKPDHGEYGKQFTGWAKRNCSHLSR